MAPVANAGVDTSIDERTPTTLAGSGTDADGTIASFAWVQTAGPTVTLADAGIADPAFDTPTVDQETMLVFELTVTDDDGATNSDTTTVTVNNADNSFAAPTIRSQLPIVPGFTIMTDILAMDLNGDQLQDLILASTGDEPTPFEGSAFQVLINDGDGTFTDESATFLPGLTSGPTNIDKLFPVDLNNDGLIDLLPGNALAPLVQQADGTFEALQGFLLDPGVITDFPVSNASAPIDFDGDGDLDIVRIEIFNNFGVPGFVSFHDIRISENLTGDDGVLAFAPWGDVVVTNPPMGLSNSLFVTSIATMDVDEDGDMDFIYGGPTFDGDGNGFVDQRVPIYFMINNGDGTFTEAAATIFNGGAPEFTHLRELAAGDVTGTGRSSVVVANHGFDAPPFPGQNNAILANLGGGMFVEDIGLADTHDYQGFTHSLTLGDVDNDGDLDIVYVDLGGNDVPLGSMNIRVLINDGTGAFQNSNLLLGPELELETWTTSFLVDLNNDGFPELVLGAQDQGSDNWVLWNSGNGSFELSAQ